MLLLTQLWCVAGLLVVACVAVVMSRSRAATPAVYGLCLVVSLIALGTASAYLVANAATPEVASLPLGLPWIGAHFRLDALAAFFLVIVDLGAAAASLFALGYGRHEAAPHRVLPF
jgi:hydrogenase-4 component B